jgi:hypothetical protein
MRIILPAFFLGAFYLPLAAAQPGEDDPARALIEKAIKAQGGEAKLAQFSAVTAKLKGTFHGLGDAVPFVGEMTVQGADQNRIVFEAKKDGQRFHLINVLDKDKGWAKLNDDLMELDDDELAEAKAGAYAEWVATLLPLKEKRFTLKPAGEAKVGKQTALGVRVSSKGQRDITLYFDKASGFLIKTQTRVKDDDNRMVTEESFFSDYKEVQGTKQAMKFTVQRDGKPYIEGEFTEVRLSEKVDPSVFAKP